MIENINQLWFTDELFVNIARYSNAYMNTRFIMQPSSSTKLFIAQEMIQFFAIIQYLRIVQVPSKEDYWSSNVILPVHSVVEGTSRKRFEEIWRNLHFQSNTSRNVSDPDIDDSELSIHLDLPSDNMIEKKLWFDKIKYFVEYARVKSRSFLRYPGLSVWIDEQTIRCTRRSTETHRIKTNRSLRDTSFLSCPTLNLVT